MLGDGGYSYGMWVVAVFNVALFLSFMLSFLKPRGNQEWRNMGVVTVFLVALFAEMYGYPLTGLMVPILYFAYVYLAKVEERCALAEFGEAYVVYARKIPDFFAIDFFCKIKNNVCSFTN